MNEVSIHLLRHEFRYNPTTGLLTNRVNRSRCALIGEEAGKLSSRGYRQVGIRGALYSVHRVAWAIHFGYWPTRLIDHINGVRDDNRISNLRLANFEESSRNRRASRRNTSGAKGVTFHKQTGRWQAQIGCGGRNHYLGLFNTVDLAQQAYERAAKRLHGEFSNLSLQTEGGAA